MDTTVKNGIIQPRYFQYAKDKITAQQSMEPIAITHGMGPICGFDIIQDSEKFTITGSSAIHDSSLLTKYGRFSSNQVIPISVNGVYGMVVNAHYTANGLLSIDPVELEFDIERPSNDEHKVIAVKAIFREDTDEPIQSKPSLNNFIAYDVTEMELPGGALNHAPNLLNLSLNELIPLLATAGLTIDFRFETFIGIYQIGESSRLKMDESSKLSSGVNFYDVFGYDLPLVAYGYKWPINLPYNINSLQTLLSFKYGQSNLLPEVFERLAFGKNAEANGEGSIAIGNEAISNADEAIQFGKGVNDLPYSVQFFDTYLLCRNLATGKFEINPEIVNLPENYVLNFRVLSVLNDDNSLKVETYGNFKPPYVSYKVNTDSDRTKSTIELTFGASGYNLEELYYQGLLNIMAIPGPSMSNTVNSIIPQVIGFKLPENGTTLNPDRDITLIVPCPGASNIFNLEYLISIKRVK